MKPFETSMTQPHYIAHCDLLNTFNTPQLQLPVFSQRQHVKLSMAYTISRVATQQWKSSVITHTTYLKPSSLFPQMLFSHDPHLACFVSVESTEESLNLPLYWLAIFNLMLWRTERIDWATASAAVGCYRRSLSESMRRWIMKRRRKRW